MRRRFSSAVILLTIVATLGAARLHRSDGARRVDPEGLTVHEWGTFTSVAAADGNAAEWLPKDGPQDLPCFVKRAGACIKCSVVGTVRMETPVLYFYAPRETSVSVKVRFNKGAITEWFPQASVTPQVAEPPDLRRADFQGTIAWPTVKVMPDSSGTFPDEGMASHYYAARRTDAAPIEVDGVQEKFLFYRGVGHFAPPVAAMVLEDGRVAVKNPEGRALGNVILLHNAGGDITFEAAQTTESRMTLGGSPTGSNLSALRETLERTLAAAGLFDKEAAAMVATWHDSWFEEGTRLFYIVQRAAVDAILPLEIEPKPFEVARVFVGRLELITPAAVQEVKQAIAMNDWPAVKKHGRFITPIFSRILEETAPSDRQSLEIRLNSAYAAWAPLSTSTCR